MSELEPIPVVVVRPAKKPKQKPLKHPGVATQERLALLKQGEREFQADCGRVLAEALLWPVPEERVASLKGRIQRAKKRRVFNWRGFRIKGWKNEHWIYYVGLSFLTATFWWLSANFLIWLARVFFTALCILSSGSDLSSALKNSLSVPGRNLAWHTVSLDDYVVPLPEDVLKKMQTLAHLCEDKGIHTEFSVRHATTAGWGSITETEKMLEELEVQWQRWQGEWRLVQVKFSRKDHGQWYTQEHVVALLCGNV
jgi:hypothetical protein